MNQKLKHLSLFQREDVPHLMSMSTHAPRRGKIHFNKISCLKLLQEPLSRSQDDPFLSSICMNRKHVAGRKQPGRDHFLTVVTMPLSLNVVQIAAAPFFGKQSAQDLQINKGMFLSAGAPVRTVRITKTKLQHGEHQLLGETYFLFIFRGNLLVFCLVCTLCILPCMYLRE